MKVKQLSDSQGLSYLHFSNVKSLCNLVRGAGWTD